jgi:hypothetical protein
VIHRICERRAARSALRPVKISVPRGPPRDLGLPLDSKKAPSPMLYYHQAEMCLLNFLTIRRREASSQCGGHPPSPRPLGWQSSPDPQPVCARPLGPARNLRRRDVCLASRKVQPRSFNPRAKNDDLLAYRPAEIAAAPPRSVLHCQLSIVIPCQIPLRRILPWGGGRAVRRCCAPQVQRRRRPRSRSLLPPAAFFQESGNHGGARRHTELRKYATDMCANRPTANIQNSRNGLVGIAPCDHSGNFLLARA